MSVLSLPRLALHACRSHFVFCSASHVTMSVYKLLSRIKEPHEAGVDHGYGITSDPLTQFAVVLSALIHDAGK